MLVRNGAISSTIMVSDGGSGNGSNSGFVANAELFQKGLVDAEEAKRLINICVQKIADFDINSSECTKLKNNINNSGISKLITKIENTKKSLLEVDQQFAGEYMAILQKTLGTLDYNSLTDEEKLEYNHMVKDFDKTMLLMYEKLDNIGALSGEEKQYYEYLKVKNEQYDIQDKMSVLSTCSQAYIDLYKKNIELEKRGIDLNLNIPEDEKSALKKAIDERSNPILSQLQDALDKKIEIDNLEAELEDLYKDKEKNNGFLHPGVENEIEEAILAKEIELGQAKGIDVSDKIEYQNMNGWDRFWTDTGTFCVSAFEGLYNITEGIEDGLIMLGSAVCIVDKDWATEYVARDLSGEMYQGLVLSTNMNTHSAYGDAHTAGMAFGNIAGHIGMSFAAPWANAVLCGLEGMGSTSEKVINEGGDYWEVLGRGALGMAGGALSGYASSSLNASVTKFVKSGTLKTIGQSAISTIKNEGFKAFVQGFGKVGAKQAGNLALHSLKDVDMWVETGCVLGDNILSGIADGEIDWGTAFKQTAAVLGTEFAMSFLMGYAMDVSAPQLARAAKQAEYEKLFNSKEADDIYRAAQQAEYEKLFNSQEADDIYRAAQQAEYEKLFNSQEADAYFKNYADKDGIIADVYKQTTGVEHVSGIDVEGANGSFVDSNAAHFNEILDEGSLSPYYRPEQVAEAVMKFETEYQGYTVKDIADDPKFREMVLDQYTINSASETAVLGKWKPTDECFSYTALANDPNFNSTYFEYGDRAAALEGVLGSDGTYEYLNRPYLENIISEAHQGNKRIILTTGPDSADWATGFYGKELSNITDILGLDSVDQLSKYLKRIEVEVNGIKGSVYEIDFELLKGIGG